MKQKIVDIITTKKKVAPRTGAWVETFDVDSHLNKSRVAPRTGAWVETSSNNTITGNTCKSRPARARGLKHEDVPTTFIDQVVAPRTGAWVETWLLGVPAGKDGVAPRTGAWVETLSRNHI